MIKASSSVHIVSALLSGSSPLNPPEIGEYPTSVSTLCFDQLTTVEKLLLLSTANHDVQREVKSGAVSVDVAVDRVKEYGEKAGDVLQKDKAAAAAQGKKKVTRSVITPEISVKKARRLVELLASVCNEEGVLALEGLVAAEVLSIIDEHKALQHRQGGKRE